jgi:class 3 adenylate cyclase/tetratricopeptide (TPR) repeat protein
MNCPKCQFENREGARFCESCGTKMELVCPACGAKIPPDRSFCGDCGHDLREPSEPIPIDYSQPQSYTLKYLAEKILTTRSSIEGERKLVTVLFADVANYTSISEKLDPEEVHQLMDGCFKILMNAIHKYEGTINQFTGDGVMALFGAPVAHEDHGQRACHAALSIQKAMEGYGEKIRAQHGAEFKLRIGLNSGPVIVGSIGDDLRMDYTAVGDTTNLAHRMQIMANPGSVIVSGNTHRLGRDFFEFSSLGKVEVKGKEEPQEAYELIRPTEVQTRIEAAAAKGLMRLVGRGKELEALREAFESAKSRSGQVVGVVGEAGVGKSRLLLELRGLLPEGEYSYLEGRCLHYGGAMPYLPILDVLKGHFDIQEEDREVTIKKKIRESLRGSNEDAEVVPPALHEVLSLKVQDEKYLQLGPQQRRERTFEAIRDLLVRESRQKPLILAVEDLHWIDKTSEDFLDYLIGFLPNARILLILLYRPEYTHTWGSKSYYGKIGLDQLSAQTSAELVQAILEGGDVTPEIAGLVLGRAGGNPLFVEELTHSLVENGSIQRKDDRFVLACKPSEIEVPETIQGIIAARMDRIEEKLKRIMQVASVIGREFSYRILQAITGMSEALKASLLNLQGLEFIYEKQLFPELEYIFKHALTQEVAYNSLLLKKRKEIHARIGQAIEQLFTERLEEYYEVLAYHYVKSHDKTKALQYLDLANQKTVQANAMEDAKAYFDQAMEMLDTLPNTPENRERRISLLVRQRDVFLWLFKLRDYNDLLTRYKPMAEEVDNLGLLGAFYASQAGCEYHSGSLDKTLELANKGLELCKDSENAQGLRMAYTLITWSHMYRGDFELTLAWKDEVVKATEARFELATYAFALTAASLSLSCLGRWDEAVQEARKVLDVAEKFSDNHLGSMGAGVLAFVYTSMGELAHAIESAELSVEKAPTLLDRAMSEAWLGGVCCKAGQVEKGIELLASFVGACRAAESRAFEHFFANPLGEGYLLAGQDEKAGETLRENLKLATRCGAGWGMGQSRRLLGEVALKNNRDEAATHFEKAISIFQEIKAENELALAYSGMGRFHKQQGNTEQAREYLTKALEIFERLGTLIEPDKVRKELADLP